MTLSLDDRDRAALAAAGIRESPDGSLRNPDGAVVEGGLAALLLRHESGAHPIQPQQFTRGPLTAGHESPSPGSQPDNSPVLPTTGSGPARYEAGRDAFNGNAARERGQHVEGREVASEPAVARTAPSPDLRAGSLPQSCDPSSLVGRAPGE